MKKIAVIGSGGAGKSTLARQLGSILHLPVYHLDAIHWQPGWKPIEREVFINMQYEILAKDRWIIDGNYGSTMDIRMNQADTVIFLHYSTIRCLFGIIKRRIQYRNKTRPDMGKDCPEKLDWEFFRWVWCFNKTYTPAIHERLSNLTETDTHIFRKPKDLKAFLTNLKENNGPIDS